MADNDSIDSDEWGAEELVIPQDRECSNAENDDRNDVGDEYWEIEKTIEKVEETNESDKLSAEDGESMIIVDITQLNPDIHSKFDRNSVNKPEEASALRKKIEKSYDEYAFSNDLLSEGTIIPCGTSVWRDALVRLRDDRPGHYFVPIFAPKAKK
uniref:Uncharacterized protein n=1 Tax=Pseudo-nitzschia delicatissima TaxID=44447 RepID=A0A7S0UNP6_9STRA|mmetsp:Transcript_4345/g.9059  ORF Transcript_4345/g.9059 Transcript_4345/m.9059 type:complete len:155 (+) Transcript_4345:137-601(+)